ncbi:hypothetical protein NEDG_00401 [Nematocida displodere]|uniref:Uncharacterized protein n=1 Tax=Nematocida displodere TaxID=1805483 RepID=A0A177EJQ8_9MICR|nr:hypothetical protein NEDG_00401 [Nematocida displodere]
MSLVPAPAPETGTVVALLLPPDRSIYEVVARVPRHLSVLLIDVECEYYGGSVLPNVRTVRVLPEEVESALGQSISEDVVVLNRIHSFSPSMLVLQRRLNLLWALVYRGKQVIASTEYAIANRARTVRHQAYIERMCTVETLGAFQVRTVAPSITGQE